jgi:poly-gamma-glutamate system protein
MEGCLRRSGIFAHEPVAVTLGGDEDTGREMDPGLRALLLEGISGSGFNRLEVPGLEENVGARMRMYEGRTRGRPIKAFVNIGGSGANIGADSSILKLAPGLARGVFIPSPEKRGVIQEMSRLGIPVIHLLNIRGLVKRYGLPWDPIPLPKPGRGGLAKIAPMEPLFFFIIAGVYLLVVLILLLRNHPVFTTPASAASKTPAGKPGLFDK